MDLISRQDTIDAITKYCTRYDLRELLADIEVLPSAQPEIIRCRDCKHFAGEGMYCANDIIVQFDHFYCYYGERGEDEEIDN